MVNFLSAYRRSGVSDWVLQRVSSVVILTYSLTVASALVSNVSYESWSAFITQLWMRIFSSVVLLSILVHAWIGVWAVMTDYVTERMLGSRADLLRLGLLFVSVVLLLGYVLWGLFIVWEL